MFSLYVELQSWPVWENQGETALFWEQLHQRVQSQPAGHSLAAEPTRAGSRHGLQPLLQQLPMA